MADPFEKFKSDEAGLRKGKNLSNANKKSEFYDVKDAELSDTEFLDAQEAKYTKPYVPVEDVALMEDGGLTEEGQNNPLFTEEYEGLVDNDDYHEITKDRVELKKFENTEPDISGQPPRKKISIKYVKKGRIEVPKIAEKEEI